MKKTFTILSLLLYSTLAVCQPVTIDKSKSDLAIQGTSSLHDWESKVEDFQATADFSEDQVLNIAFEAIVKSIKSGKSGMDNNTYKALNEKEYPKITFKANQLDIKGDQLVGNGQLTIAGKTNDIPINLTLSNASERSVKGSIKLKMTEYGVTPPTAVFGTIKTGDEVTIQFNFTLKNT
ncbi:YceI family protein [Reichenbachiella sp.]|uniref:YceI family protein n=1 Tax=Reichenbachiella sp. TaxID=2184521 RepID=UPI003B5A4961